MSTADTWIKRVPADVAVACLSQGPRGEPPPPLLAAALKPFEKWAHRCPGPTPPSVDVYVGALSARSIQLRVLGRCGLLHPAFTLGVGGDIEKGPFLRGPPASVGLAPLRDTWPHLSPGLHSFTNMKRGWMVQGEEAREGRGSVGRGHSEDPISGRALCSGLCGLVSLILSLLTCKGSRWDQISG